MTNCSFSKGKSSRHWGKDVNNNHRRKPLGQSKRIRWISLSPLLASLLIYLNSLHGDFVHDDILAVIRNPDVIGAREFWHVFSHDFWGCPLDSDNSHKSFRPIVTIVFRLVFGLCRGSPVCFHGLNVCLHLATTVLFQWLLQRGIGTLAGPFGTPKAIVHLAALLFAIHPIHTEAVSGIVGCADLLSALFTLLAVAIVVRFISLEVQSWMSIMWCLTASVMALFSKETGICALAINIALMIYRSLDKQGGRKRKSTKVPKVDRTIVAFSISLLSLLSFRLMLNSSKSTAMSGVVPNFSSQDNPASFNPNFGSRILTLFYLPVLSFWLLICPSSLSYDWQMGSVEPIMSIFELRFVAIIAFYMGLIKLFLSTFSTKQHGPVDIWLIRLALLFLVLPYIPASNLFVTVGFVIAERILYLPSIGFCILISLGCSRLKSVTMNGSKARGAIYKAMGYVTIAITLTALASKTWTRNWDWTSREALFRSGVKSHPGNAKMHYNFGNWLRDQGSYEMASLHYKEAIRLWPSYTLAFNNLAAVAKTEAESEMFLREALKADPGHPNALYNFALIQRRKGQCWKAVPMLERCIFEDVLHEDAKILLYECIAMNNTDDNVPIRIDDSFSLVGMGRNGLGDVLSKNEVVTSQLVDAYISLGQFSKAHHLLTAFLQKHHPRRPHWILYQLSQALLMQSLPHKALSTIRQATADCSCRWGGCDDMCTRIITQEADILMDMNHFEQAAMKYSEALLSSPNDPRLLLSLGTMYHVLGRSEEALEMYLKSQEIDPDNGILQENLNRVRANKTHAWNPSYD